MPLTIGRLFQLRRRWLAIGKHPLQLYIRSGTDALQGISLHQVARRSMTNCFALHEHRQVLKHQLIVRPRRDPDDLAADDDQASPAYGDATKEWSGRSGMRLAIHPLGNAQGGRLGSSVDIGYLPEAPEGYGYDEYLT